MSGGPGIQSISQRSWVKCLGGWIEIIFQNTNSKLNGTFSFKLDKSNKTTLVIYFIVILLHQAYGRILIKTYVDQNPEIFIFTILISEASRDAGAQAVYSRMTVNATGCGFDFQEETKYLIFSFSSFSFVVVSNLFLNLAQ